MSEFDVAITVAEHLPSLPPDRAGNPFNFTNDVFRFLTRWCAAYGSSIPIDQPAYCCFIGCERVTTTAEDLGGFIERPMFRDDTPQDLLGNIYLASEPLIKVFSRVVATQSLAQCEAEVAQLGLPDGPVVIFNAAERRMFWKLKGAESYSTLVLAQSQLKLTSDDFENALTQFHRTYTETPSGFGDIWEDAGQMITRRNTERGIRNNLYLFLRNLMPDWAVFCEYYNPAGRADLLVHFHEAAKTFAIELKVLRAFRLSKGVRKAVSEKFNAWWGARGIAQAHSYKQCEPKISKGYACCFDARKDNAEISALDDLAKKLDVNYLRFYMFNSADRLHESYLN